MFSIFGILAFLLMITILVAIHEFGHYITARVFGMGVEEFTIGMGKPILVRWMRKRYRVGPGPTDFEETDFTIRPLPIGGFVRIKGMEPAEDGSETSISGGFFSKAPWKRFIVLFAGPLFSILAGVIVLGTYYSIAGVYRGNPEAVLDGMIQEGAAYKGGLRPGDKVVSVDGAPVSSFYDLIVKVRDVNGRPVHLTYLRDGKNFDATVVPEIDDKPTPVIGPDLDYTGEMRKQSKLGIKPSLIKRHLGVATAFSDAAMWPVKAVVGMVDVVRQPKTFKDNVGGPITMVAATTASVEQGWDSFMQLCCLISISVGIFNLLPIVPLDGGQMLVAFVEMLRGGKRLSMRIQNLVATAGVSMVILLICSVLFVDVTRVAAPEKPGKTYTFVGKDSPKTPPGKEVADKK